MSRRITSRLKITGDLVAQGPLHVGGMAGNADVDLALAVDGKNRFYVPGTSLIGPMRAWLRRRLPENEHHRLNCLFGPEQEKGQEDEGHASYVIIEDGLINFNGAEIQASLLETRDGVGLNRITGTAAETIKYDRAVLPNGSGIRFEMTVELATEDVASWAKPVIGGLIAALKDEKIRFGAARTRGLGRVKLEDCVIKEQTLLVPLDFLKALRLGGETLNDFPARALSWPRLELRVTWKPKSALMVKAERDGLAVDILPLTSAINDKLTFVLPGSSIKGALRSQAERIVRTVRGFSAPAMEDKKQEFLRQLQVPLVNELFGQAALRDSNGTAKNKSRAGLGALSVEDCYAKPRFSRTQWQQIEQANPEIEKASDDASALRRALDDAGLPDSQMAMHVAVDRWTGGAADGFLYSVLEPHGVAWGDISLTLDLARLQRALPETKEQRAAVALLLLTLRDMAAERVPLGFGVNRGMGAIHGVSATITAHDVTDNALQQWEAVTLKDGSLGGLHAEIKQDWKNWATRAPAETANETETDADDETGGAQ